MISAVEPQEQKVDCVAILEMKKRMSYVKQLIDNHLLDTNHIFLLTGERYSLQNCNSDAQESVGNKCFVEQDGGIDYIQSLALKNNIPPRNSNRNRYHERPI